MKSNLAVGQFLSYVIVITSGMYCIQQLIFYVACDGIQRAQDYKLLYNQWNGHILQHVVVI